MSALPLPQNFKRAGSKRRVPGGTDEILLNVIADRVLGLPSEMRVDKDKPFNDLPVGR